MLVITRREGEEVVIRDRDGGKLIERKGSGPGGSPVVGGVAPSPMRGGL